ncbi:actin-7-related [Anaeramoeba ignava]|uniref:Actin-7-related n=1 Tax=Anaeramoeba ignava TaxID=1746090 RepID=A0A9Q0LME6_ANAIG|nr:actin-7-related [Anaeramoeba ignava]
MNDFVPETIVIDNGTSEIRAGIAGEDEPIKILPTIIGKPKNFGVVLGMGKKDYYIGKEAQFKKEILNLENPIQKGIITNWENMEKIWNYLFENELKINPSETPILLAETILTPKKDREKVTEIMFEKFQVSQFYVGFQEVLSLYANGRTTGIVIDLGEEISRGIPIIEGYSVPNSIFSVDIGGSDLTEYLIQMINQKNYPFTHSLEKQVFQEIKEKICYVDMDFNDKMEIPFQSNLENEIDFDLGDGNVIKLGNERIKCPEAFFKPLLIGKEEPAIHETVFNSIMKFEPSKQKDFLCHILLTGRSSFFPGIQERFQAELYSLLNPKTPLKVVLNQDFKYTAWVGGSILASLTCNYHMWIRKEEYKESGCQIVHKKCY